MDYKRRIESIIARAERIHVALSDVAAAGGISKSTLYRWQQDDANPRIRSMLNALDAMEGELDRREGELLDALQRGAA